MSGEEGEGEGEEGKLPSVDHGRRTDRGRDKKRLVSAFFTIICLILVILTIIKNHVNVLSKFLCPMVQYDDHNVYNLFLHCFKISFLLCTL